MHHGYIGMDSDFGFLFAESSLRVHSIGPFLPASGCWRNWMHRMRKESLIYGMLSQTWSA